MPIQKLETTNVLKQWMDTINIIIDDSSELKSSLNEKVDKETGKGLSTNDFTNALKDKLDGIEAGANNYTLPTANNNTLGGVTLSDSTSSESGVDNGVAATPKAVKSVYDLASNALPKAGGTIEGDLTVTGKINATIEGNSDTANKLSVARTIALTGDVSGSTTFDGSNDVSITVTVADDSHNHTIANIDNLETLLATKAGTTSPTFVGTPKAPTAASGTNTTQIATTAFVQSAIDSKIATADAMIFKGTIGTNGTVTTLPAEHSIGWTYKVATSGTYAGVNCEVGDMIVCLADGTTASDADWTVIQTNIDGAVTGPVSSVDERIAVFDGTTGKIIKDSGFTIASSVPADAKFTDTTYSVGTDTTAGIAKLYSELGTATDGAMSQAATKSALDTHNTDASAHSDLRTLIDNKQSPATTLSGYGITDAYTKTEVEALYNRLNTNTVLGFYCIEDVTIVTNGVSTVHPANSNVEVKFVDGDTWEIIPTSNNSILTLTAFPGALGTFYPWLEGVKQFSNILFDMNSEDMYTKWNQGNQGAYQVQFAQYSNCIFWSDLPYISDVAKRTNYTLYYSAQIPLCYSSIPDNTFKSFYLAFNVNSDPNWGNQAYRDSFAKATWATQAFSYYGGRTIGIFDHDNSAFNIPLPTDCRGLMYAATAVENAGIFDATNTTNFGAKSGSWRDAFGFCKSLRNLYIKNLKVGLNVSWSPLNYDSIYFIISEAANTNSITITVSPYTYNLLSQSDFELAASKNITIELLTTNYVEDTRLSAVTITGDGSKVLSNDGTYKTLPTKTSQLENDNSFVSSTELASIATTGNASDLNGTVAIAHGGTGASTAAGALVNLGITATAEELNYVDGVTSNVQTQLNAKAPLESPALTGTPTAPTADAGTNTTQIATTAFVSSAIANLVDSAPETLNTLGELATALSENVEVTDALNEAIGSKANDADVVKLSGNQTIDGTKTFSSTITGSISGNATSADKLSNGRTIALTGDVSGSTTFDGSNDVSITVTVADYSHNHTVANIDNLETLLATKAGTTSPTFVGTPKAPTAAAGTNTTQIATTAFVQSEITNVISEFTDENVKVESSNNTKIYLTGSSSTSATGSLLVDSGVYISETPGELVATTFTGSLNGNALSATKDSSGNVIVDTYLTKEDFEEYKESGEIVDASEAIWTVTEGISENTIVTIPNGVVYPYNKNAIRVSVDGLILSKNVNYEEVPSTGMSSQIKFLFNVEANSVIQVWVAPQSEIKGSLDFIQSSVETTTQNVEQCRQYVQNAGIIDNLEAILNSKASIESPTLTGTPTAPTADAGTNTTQIATTSFVTNAVNNKVSYDRVVIDRGNLLSSDDPYLALLSIDINNVDYYKVLAPYGTGAFVVGLFDRPVTTEEEFMYRFGGGAMESSQVEAQDTTNTSDDIIVDSLGIVHPAPQILENGNHLKTIMIDIECTNIGYENFEPSEFMLLDLDNNNGNSTADAWGPGYEIYEIYWPQCVFWPNGTPPEFSGNRCAYLLVSYDGGYTWIGMSSAINVPVLDYTESSEPEIG